MERIIISEIDNTSNVEGLSSYDVVYVPGFATNDASPLFEDGTTLYRNPTLCTTKYEFINLYGDTCPTFPKAQPYPIATSNDWGFPYYAIPNYVPAETPTLVSRLNNFTCTGTDRTDVINAVIDSSATTNYYTYVDTTVEGWAPTTGVIYYQAVLSNSIVTMTYFDTEEHTSGYAAFILFTCGESPVSNTWYEKINDEYILTSDDYVAFDDSDVVKDYYATNSATLSLMFKGPSETSLGDADPGYRYALYLLSLGIPVYYEQMNSIFVEVDMNDTTMYKTDSQGNVSPVLNEWSILNGTVYVKTSDTTIQEGTTYYTGSDISIDSMYAGLIARFGGDTSSSTTTNPTDYSFDSIGDYAVKYLTSGGYPTFEYGPLVTSSLTQKIVGSSPLAESMIRLAAEREDAIALIDHTNNPNRTIYESDSYSVVNRVRDEFSSLGSTVDSYGALFTPWYTCTNSVVTGGTQYNYESQMPASLAFLSALAQQIKNYNPWLAVSGVVRGQVPYCGGLHTNFQLTNNVADSYQVLPNDTTGLQGGAISINPITYIRNYGYCIWGNRTLRNNISGTKATSFLNIRDLVSDVKKKLYEAARELLFEQNTTTLWVNFKSIVTPLLDTMVSNYILESYSITKYNIDPETGLQVPAYKVLAIIKIVPINSVEVFELQVQLENSELTVAETE